MLIGNVCFPIDCTPVGYRNGEPQGLKSALLGYSTKRHNPNENVAGRVEV